MAKEEKNIKEKSVRVNWIYPDELQSHFVSNMVVQFQPESFILSFFEVWPPAILGETEAEKQRAIAAINSVDAKCVARLVVTPTKIAEFIETMKQNFQNYEKSIQKVISE